MGNVSKLQYSQEKRSCRLFDIDQITPKIRVQVCRTSIVCSFIMYIITGKQQVLRMVYQQLEYS